MYLGDFVCGVCAHVTLCGPVCARVAVCMRAHARTSERARAWPLLPAPPPRRQEGGGQHRDGASAGGGNAAEAARKQRRLHPIPAIRDGPVAPRPDLLGLAGEIRPLRGGQGWGRPGRGLLQAPHIWLGGRQNPAGRADKGPPAACGRSGRRGPAPWRVPLD